MQRYCPPLADLLDREFETIKNLTYGSLGDLKGVDTFKVQLLGTLEREKKVG